MLTVPGLSFSRRRISKVAMEEESPIDVNVDRSPVGAMPSSSKRLLVGNLYILIEIKTHVRMI